MGQCGFVAFRSLGLEFRVRGVRVEGEGLEFEGYGSKIRI